MKRSEIRDFIKSGIDEVEQIVQFGNGRITEFNSNRSNEYIATWLESLQCSTTLNNSVPQDTWRIVIHIADKDKIDSRPEQYEAIADECDYIAQQLVKKYNDVVTGSHLITMSNISRVPFIKKHADDVTKVVLSFDLVTYDQTVIC